MPIISFSKWKPASENLLKLIHFVRLSQQFWSQLPKMLNIASIFSSISLAGFEKSSGILLKDYKIYPQPRTNHCLKIPQSIAENVFFFRHLVSPFSFPSNRLRENLHLFLVCSILKTTMKCTWQRVVNIYNWSSHIKYFNQNKLVLLDV